MYFFRVICVIRGRFFCVIRGRGGDWLDRMAAKLRSATLVLRGSPRTSGCAAASRGACNRRFERSGDVRHGGIPGRYAVGIAARLALEENSQDFPPDCRSPGALAAWGELYGRFSFCPPLFGDDHRHGIGANENGYRVSLLWDFCWLAGSGIVRFRCGFELPLRVPATINSRARRAKPRTYGCG